MKPANPTRLLALYDEQRATLEEIFVTVERNIVRDDEACNPSVVEKLVDKLYAQFMEERRMRNGTPYDLAPKA